jgi:hypothetical protein
MTAPVVDYPEHAFCGSVGLNRHDLIDEAVEGFDASGSFAAAEDFGLPAIPGRQVRQGPPALAFMFNPCISPRSWRQCRVATMADRR